MSAELHLPNLTNTPPNGWSYLVPETGKRIKGNTMGACAAAVANHYTANDLPAPLNIHALIEQQICHDYPAYCQSQNGITKFATDARRTVAMIISGTRTIGSWMIAGRPLVSTEIAEGRAGVCVKCSMNQKPSGCTGCSMASLRKVIEQVVGGAKTKYDDQLEACMVCGCSLKAKTAIPHDILEKNMPRDVFEQLPPHCWLVTEAIKQ